MINQACILANSGTKGCCYMQDRRPKFVSHTRKFRDRVGKLPMLAYRASYIDGPENGDITRQTRFTDNLTVCYIDYCTECQKYWHRRILPNNLMTGLRYATLN